MTVSICTIARGRDRHLRNLVQGLGAQTRRPAELVIAHMQPDAYTDLPGVEFPVRQIPVPGDRTPLAAARNAAAHAATGDTLVFLDVDCIPLPDLIVGYVAALAPDRCLMGETRYLAQTHRPEDMTPEALWQASLQHPARAFSEKLGPGVRRIARTTEFWSLSFSLAAATFRKIGGFDPAFDGYGGEDTDFALRLGQSHVDLHWVPAARARAPMARSPETAPGPLRRHHRKRHALSSQARTLVYGLLAGAVRDRGLHRLAAGRHPCPAPPVT